MRERWLRDGSLPVYDAKAHIDPDGAIHLRRGAWTATASPTENEVVSEGRGGLA